MLTAEPHGPARAVARRVGGLDDRAVAGLRVVRGTRRRTTPACVAFRVQAADGPAAPRAARERDRQAGGLGDPQRASGGPGAAWTRPERVRSGQPACAARAAALVPGQPTNVAASSGTTAPTPAPSARGLLLAEGRGRTRARPGARRRRACPGPGPGSGRRPRAPRGRDSRRPHRPANRGLERALRLWRGRAGGVWSLSSAIPESADTPPSRNGTRGRRRSVAEIPSCVTPTAWRLGCGIRAARRRGWWTAGSVPCAWERGTGSRATLARMNALVAAAASVRRWVDVPETWAGHRPEPLVVERLWAPGADATGADPRHQAGLDADDRVVLVGPRGRPPGACGGRRRTGSTSSSARATNAPSQSTRSGGWGRPCATIRQRGAASPSVARVLAGIRGRRPRWLSVLAKASRDDGARPRRRKSSRSRWSRIRRRRRTTSAGVRRSRSGSTANRRPARRGGRGVPVVVPARASSDSSAILPVDVQLGAIYRSMVAGNPAV